MTTRSGHDAVPFPTVFIGSSTEHLDTARVLKQCLRPHARTTVWDEQDFELNESTFGGLLTAADQFDFAVFILDADDLTQIRNTTVPTVRDNVLFEFGLFTGRIGRGRAFWISAQGAQAPHVPTDLAGITHLKYERPADRSADAFRTALENACDRLRAEMERMGPRTDRTVEVVDHVRILCAASSQYAEPEFAHDIEMIQRNFPAGSIESAHGVTAAGLLDTLTSQRWDIVHLAMYVDPERGELIIPSPESGSGPVSKDRVRPDGVAELVASAGARLVVIVTCDALALAARVARITNTIAGHKPIDVRAALNWSAVFYKFLAQGAPLSEAFNRAQTLTDPGLLLLAKRDFRLALPIRRGASARVGARIGGE